MKRVLELIPAVYKKGGEHAIFLGANESRNPRRLNSSNLSNTSPSQLKEFLEYESPILRIGTPPAAKNEVESLLAACRKVGFAVDAGQTENEFWVHPGKAGMTKFHEFVLKLWMHPISRKL